MISSIPTRLTAITPPSVTPSSINRTEMSLYRLSSYHIPIDLWKDSIGGIGPHSSPPFNRRWLHIGFRAPA